MGCRNNDLTPIEHVLVYVRNSSLVKNQNEWHASELYDIICAF
jgi:hypothetical protein